MNFLRSIFGNLFSRDSNGKTIGQRIMTLSKGGIVIIAALGIIAVAGLLRINSYSNMLLNLNIRGWALSNALENEVRAAGEDLNNYVINPYNTAFYERAMERFSDMEQYLAETIQLVDDYDMQEEAAALYETEENILAYREAATAYHEAMTVLLDNRRLVEESVFEFQQSMQDYRSAVNDDLTRLIESGATGAEVEELFWFNDAANELLYEINTAITQIWRSEVLDDLSAMEEIEETFLRERDLLGEIHEREQDPMRQVSVSIALAVMNDNIVAVQNMIESKQHQEEQETIRMTVYEEILASTAALAEVSEVSAYDMGERTNSMVQLLVAILGIGAVIAISGAIIMGKMIQRSVNDILGGIIDRLSGGAEQVNASSTQLSRSEERRVGKECR